MISGFLISHSINFNGPSKAVLADAEPYGSVNYIRADRSLSGGPRPATLASPLTPSSLRIPGLKPGASRAPKKVKRLWEGFRGLPGFPENELVEFLGVHGGRPPKAAKPHGSSRRRLNIQFSPSAAYRVRKNISRSAEHLAPVRAYRLFCDISACADAIYSLTRMRYISFGDAICLRKRKRKVGSFGRAE